MIKKYLKILKSEEYKSFLPKINETNRKNIIFVSAVIIAVITVLLIILPFANLLNFAYPIYIGFEIATILILLECIFIKPKSSPLIVPLTVALILDMLTFGACLSFFNNSGRNATVFFVLLFSIPLIFTLHPRYSILITIVVASTFLAVEHHIKTPKVFKLDLINTICYSIINIIAGSYMLIIKYRAHCLQEENKKFNDLKLKESEIELNKQMEILRSLSGIYNSVHLIDLEENTVVEYVSNPNIRKFVNTSEDAITQMHNSMDSLIIDEYKQKAFEFTDLTTLQQRMEEQKIITMDMIGVYTGWMRASFIANTTNSFEQPTQVLFTTQIIKEA